MTHKTGTMTLSTISLLQSDIVHIDRRTSKRMLGREISVDTGRVEVKEHVPRMTVSQLRDLREC